MVFRFAAFWILVLQHSGDVEGQCSSYQECPANNFCGGYQRPEGGYQEDQCQTGPCNTGIAADGICPEGVETQEGRYAPGTEAVPLENCAVVSPNTCCYHVRDCPANSWCGGYQRPEGGYYPDTCQTGPCNWNIASDKICPDGVQTQEGRFAPSTTPNQNEASSSRCLIFTMAKTATVLAALYASFGAGL